MTKERLIEQFNLVFSEHFFESASKKEQFINFTWKMLRLQEKETAIREKEQYLTECQGN